MYKSGRLLSNRLIMSFVFLSVSVYVSAIEQYENEDHVWFSAAKAGIYYGRFSYQTGALSDVKQSIEGVNSSYIVQHPTQAILYSINHGNNESVIVSYHIAKNGSLTKQSELSGLPTGGAHINVNRAGTLIAVAFYSGSTTGVYSIKKDGSIGTTLMEHRHTGNSIFPQQSAPHPHWAGFSKDGNYLYVPDLGTDEIWVYKLNNKRTKLSLVHKITSEAGSGPRHLAFHPTKNFAYASNEISSTVTAYKINTQTGLLTAIGSFDSAAGAKDELASNVSDLRVHPNGHFLYVANRGFDRVAVFAIDQVSGKLHPVENEPIRGSISRNLVITKGGDWALVAGVKSNTLAVFHVDPLTGEMHFKYDHIYYVPNARSIVINRYVN